MLTPEHESHIDFYDFSKRVLCYLLVVPAPPPEVLVRGCISAPRAHRLPTAHVLPAVCQPLMLSQRCAYRSFAFACVLMLQSIYRSYGRSGVLTAVFSAHVDSALRANSS